MRDMRAYPGRGLKRDQPYEAVVIDENDPSKLGCIRARVVGIMDEIPDDQLPWARPRNWNHPFGQMFKQKASVGRTSFFLGVPRRGNKVNLYFPTGDPHVPMYDASAPIDEKSKDAVYDVNYPNRMGFRFPNGLQVLIDTKTNELFFINPGDYHCTFFGDVNQTIVGNQQLLVTGDKGEVPAYILNDPNLSAKNLTSDPKQRIPFNGLLGRKVGSQHTEIKGHQTVVVHGDRKEVIKGDYSLDVKNLSVNASGKIQNKAKGQHIIKGSKVSIN